MDKDKLKEILKVVRVNHDEFELDDGTVFPHTFYLENVPTTKEFQKIYEYWRKSLDSMHPDAILDAQDENAYESLREELIIQRDLVGEIMELEEENEELKLSINKLLTDTSMKEFVNRESERANRNGNRASMFEVRNMDLRKENQKLSDLLSRSRSAINELIKDTNLEDDDSKEFILMQEINETLKNKLE